MRAPRGRAEKLRDGALLGLSAIVTVVAAGANLESRYTPEVQQAAPDPTALEPPPLPSGAAPGMASFAVDETEAGCHFADRGFGEYERWRPLPLGRVLIPRALGVGADGGFDALVHFNGSDAIRKQLAPEAPNLVIAGVDLAGLSSQYVKAFADPAAWTSLVTSLEREVGKALDLPRAHVRHLAISSWSAGYGAVAQILEQRRAPLPDALILLDSLHAGYAAGSGARIDPGKLPLFIESARAAAAGGPLFYLTHTSIQTDGYASTSETSEYLLHALGVTASPVTPDPEGALRLTGMFERGRLFVRGYAGGAKEDHCEQLRLLPPILLEHVLPAFAADKKP